MNDLERLLDAVGSANLHYISFDNPPVRMPQELSAAQEQNIQQEIFEPSVQSLKTSGAGEIVMLDAQMIDTPVSMKNVHDGDHNNKHQQTSISLLRMEGSLSIFTLKEHQPGSSAPAELIDPSRHASSALAGSAVPPRTTLDRLRAGEMRP